MSNPRSSVDERLDQRPAIVAASVTSARAATERRCRRCGSLDVTEIGRDRRAGLLAVWCNECQRCSAVGSD